METQLNHLAKEFVPQNFYSQEQFQPVKLKKKHKNKKQQDQREEIERQLKKFGLQEEAAQKRDHVQRKMVITDLLVQQVQQKAQLAGHLKKVESKPIEQNKEKAKMQKVRMIVDNKVVSAIVPVNAQLGVQRVSRKINALKRSINQFRDCIQEQCQMTNQDERLYYKWQLLSDITINQSYYFKNEDPLDQQDQICVCLLKKLYDLYQKAKNKQGEMKAKKLKYYVVGLKEIIQNLQNNRIQLVILAKDIEPIPELQQLIETIQSLCNQNQKQLIIACKRKKIGKAIKGGSFKISGVGITNLDEVQEFYHQLVNNI